MWHIQTDERLVRLAEGTERLTRRLCRGSRVEARGERAAADEPATLELSAWIEVGR